MDLSAPNRPPHLRRKKRPSLLWRMFTWMFTFGIVVFVGGCVAAGYIIWSTATAPDMPDYERLASYEPPVMTRIHAHDGALIAEYAKERRIYVPINAIPDVIIKAVISAEDKNFFKHGGLDIQGIFKAVVRTVIVKLTGGGRRAGGASTITQQVAKNFLLSSERTLERKLKEAILAIRIERAFTKEQILELYLNEIFLGLRSYGIAAAALNYYGKSLDEITLAEAAYFAALPKGPNNYHPFRKTQKAIDRRNWVLDRMVDNGFVTSEQAEAAKQEGLNVNPRPFGAHIFAADYFAEEVRRELVARYGEDRLLAGGLSVRTTLDPKLQVMARKALIDGLVAYDRRHGWRGVQTRIELTEDWGAQLAAIDMYNDIDPFQMAVVLKVSAKEALIGLRPRKLPDGQWEEERYTGIVPLKEVLWAKRKVGKKLGAAPAGVNKVLKIGDVIYVAPRLPGEKESVESVQGQWSLMQLPEVQGAIIAMDPHTGRIHALVGGFSYDQSSFDRAFQANRQPGSAFKPFVYTAALDNGYTPASVVLDAPIAIDQGPGQELWRPKNYGKRFYGPSTLRLGLEKSRNLMTVRLAQDVGMPIIAEYARRFGIYENLLPVLSMSLGAGETTLMQLTNAYCMLANGGKQVKATLIDRIQDRYGRTIMRHDPRQCDACRAQLWDAQEEPVLQDVRAQIVNPHTAYQITSMLEGVVQRGTATKVKAVGKPIAGKTGTTNEEKDAWFIGYSPDLVVGVFVGFDTPTPMGKGETGGGVASPIFRDFMKMALADKPAIPFRIPPGIQLIRINAKTGVRARSGDRNVILEAFKPGTQPPDFLPYYEQDPYQGETQYDVPNSPGGLY